ncbi:hydroxysqualene dehydroxylase HpnE [Pyruvatibacter mobilis]|uniref:hydroxysqualene dehydroxylase HpnE n=1 Tax=Pyruvatibacter mobilis TaxID=1712261 RepID=UPI003C7980FE
MPTVHVIGAGLAGLSAAVALENAGVPVQLYEAAGHAGGRCRSFHDKTLDHVIDNGNHLVLSGNKSALAYLDAIGAGDAMFGPPKAAFPFIDAKTRERWTLRPNWGPLPWWVMSQDRRVLNTRLSDYLPGLKLPFAKPDQTVADIISSKGTLYQRFWEPLVVAVLNTVPEKGAAKLMWPVMKETFLKGEQACRPLTAKKGLGAAFVDPAVRLFSRTNRPIRFNTRLRGLTYENGRVTSLSFGDQEVKVEANDSVVLAVPPQRMKDLMPALDVPEEGETILNVHFRLRRPAPKPDGVGVIGLINAHAHWAFVRGHIVSLTVSAAGDLADKPAEELLSIFWEETRFALGLIDKDYVAGKVIKEKRATFDQSPASVAKRPGMTTEYDNLLLAGDWTDTGLPATIEGAIRSGKKAADHILAHIDR